MIPGLEYVVLQASKCFLVRQRIANIGKSSQILKAFPYEIQNKSEICIDSDSEASYKQFCC